MVLHKKEREMIYNVHSFMKKEADIGSVNNIKQAMKRTAEATKSCVATVRRIVKAVRDCKSEFPDFDTPSKNKRNKKKPKTDIDNVNKGIIRRAIHTFHVFENELPTLSKLRKKFQNEINFQGSETSLARVIKDLGFEWLKIENTNRRLLLEKSHIRLKRIEYLQLIRKYRVEGRPIIFTDESYIDSTHLVPQNNSTKDGEPEEGSKSTNDIPKPPKVRLIIVHAGGETCLVPNALLTFEVSSKPGETNHITFDIYQRWLQNKLIPNLPANSVVVIKNAPYHNKKHEPAPLSKAKIIDMRSWLTQKGIPYEETMLKPQLYDLIKAHKDQYKQLTIENILGEKGHSVLHLPPHNEDLNPFEMAWLEIRRHVAMNTETWDVKRVTDLVNEKMGLIEVVEWANFTKEVTEIEQIYRNNEQVIDTLSESFVISGYDDINNTDSEDECSSDDNFSDEEPPPKVNTASISGLQPVALTRDCVKTGSHPVIGFENEKSLVKHILKLGLGFPPDRRSVRILAYQYAEKLKIKHNFNRETQMAGAAWCEGFFERNPELSVRQAECLSLEGNPELDVRQAEGLSLEGNPELDVRQAEGLSLEGNTELDVRKAEVSLEENPEQAECLYVEGNPELDVRQAECLSLEGNPEQAECLSLEGNPELGTTKGLRREPSVGEVNDFNDLLNKVVNANDILDKVVNDHDLLDKQENTYNMDESDKLDQASKNSFLYVNIAPQPLMNSSASKNQQDTDKKGIIEEKTPSLPPGEWNPIKVEPADQDTEIIDEPEIYHPGSDSESEALAPCRNKKRKVNNGDDDPKTPKQDKEDSSNEDARKMFLLSLLPDVRSMTESEMRVFRKTTIACIESIFDSREKT